MSKSLKKLLPIAASIAGAYFLPGIGASLGASIGSTGGAAIGSGIGTLASGQGLKSAALNAAGSYVGGSIGKSLGSSLGTFGSAANSAGVNLGQSVAGESIGASLGNFAGNVAPGLTSSIAGTSIGGALGGYVGGNMAQSYEDPKNAGMAQSTGAAPFKPTRAADEEIPSSLSSFSALNPNQRTSNLATQGVYGSGLGPEESRYFLNQVNNKLVDEGGNVGEMSQLSPIEMSYLQKLGIGGAANSNNLLEAISKWKAA